MATVAVVTQVLQEVLTSAVSFVQVGVSWSCCSAVRGDSRGGGRDRDKGGGGVRGRCMPVLLHEAAVAAGVLWRTGCARQLGGQAAWRHYGCVLALLNVRSRRCCCVVRKPSPPMCGCACHHGRQYGAAPPPRPALAPPPRHDHMHKHTPWLVCRGRRQMPFPMPCVCDWFLRCVLRCVLQVEGVEARALAALGGPVYLCVLGEPGAVHARYSGGWGKRGRAAQGTGAASALQHPWP